MSFPLVTILVPPNYAIGITLQKGYGPSLRLKNIFQLDEWHKSMITHIEDLNVGRFIIFSVFGNFPQVGFESTFLCFCLPPGNQFEILSYGFLQDISESYFN